MNKIQLPLTSLFAALNNNNNNNKKPWENIEGQERVDTFPNCIHKMFESWVKKETKNKKQKQKKKTFLTCSQMLSDGCKENKQTGKVF